MRRLQRTTLACLLCCRPADESAATNRKVDADVRLASCTELGFAVDWDVALVTERVLLCAERYLKCHEGGHGERLDRCLRADGVPSRRATAFRSMLPPRPDRDGCLLGAEPLLPLRASLVVWTCPEVAPLVQSAWVSCVSSDGTLLADIGRPSCELEHDTPW